MGIFFIVCQELLLVHKETPHLKGSAAAHSHTSSHLHSAHSSADCTTFPQLNNSPSNDNFSAHRFMHLTKRFSSWTLSLYLFPRLCLLIVCCRFLTHLPQCALNIPKPQSFPFAIDVNDYNAMISHYLCIDSLHYRNCVSLYSIRLLLSRQSFSQTMRSCP